MTTADATSGVAQPPGTVRLGSPFGIPVTVSLAGTGLLVAVVALSTVPLVQRVSPHSSTATAVAVGVVAGLLLQLSVLVHEISHCVVARALGLQVRGLHLRMIAGLTEIEGELDTPDREYLVAVAGPFATIVLAALGGVPYTLSGVPDRWFVPGSSGTVLDVLVYGFVLSNLLLALFNLLPGMPLDGGRVLRSVVWRLSGRVWVGTRAAAYAGQGVGALTAGYGLLQVTRQNPNGVLAVVAGFYVGSQAVVAARQARLEQATPGLSVARLLRRAVVVPTQMPLGEAIRRAALIGATAAVVVDDEGKPRMVLQGTAVDAVPEERRPWVPVTSVCATVRDGMVLDVRLAGRQLLDAMQARPASEYVVVDSGPGGHGVVGVLAAVDVAAAVG